MQPTANRLLVRVEKEVKVVKKDGEEEAKGDAVMRAEVLKVGPKVEDVAIGEMVVFAPYGIEEVMVDKPHKVNGPKIGQEKLLIVSEELIIATYEQTKPNTKAKR